MATIDWPERLLLRLSIGGHEAEGKVWTHARHNAAATARSGERADQIDLSWLSPAERAALRRQLIDCAPARRHKRARRLKLVKIEGSKRPMV